MEEHVLICEDSMDGILTGVYEAYQYKKDKGIESHARIHLAVKDPDTQRFFTQYSSVAPDAGKAEKVAAAVNRQFGEEAYSQFCLAMVSCFEEKADAVYHTIAMGLAAHDRKIMDRLQEECVHKVFVCARAANNELNRFREFLRFAELDNGLLYAKIDAGHHILPFLMPHFSDRLPAEDFIIYDENLGIFGIHPRLKQWYIFQGVDLDEGSLRYSRAEEEYQKLFCCFCDTIAIESRINPKLQLSMLPIRFRPNMTEFVTVQTPPPAKSKSHSYAILRDQSL